MSAEGARQGGLFDGDAWAWWQARRLRYNIVLAVAGWVAYGAALLVALAFHKPMWRSWQDGLGVTLLLGAGFLMLMGLANIAYLLGPAVEGWSKPEDVLRYRRTAYAMGLVGSAAAPFLFTLVMLAFQIGASAPS